MSVSGELTLTVPAELVKKSVGFSMDIGGSLVKIVYRSEENAREVENNKTSKNGHLQLVSFPKTRLNEALEYVRRRAKITRNGSGESPEVLTTGLGCTEFRKSICETLNIRTRNITEMDCFVKAFCHLASEMTREELLEPIDEGVARQGEQEILSQLAVFTDESKMTSCFGNLRVNLASDPVDADRHPNDPLAKSEDIYPCILAMVGSGIAYLKINADRSSHFLDVCNRGGKSFHGMASLLTRCKDFDELEELASRGDPTNVDVYYDVLFRTDGAADGDNSVYVKAAEISVPAVVYCFGKAVGAKLEDLRREDLARAWVNYCASDIAQSLCLVAQLYGIKRIFFSGSFTNSSLLRRVLTGEMAKRTTFAKFSDVPSCIGFDFLKPGSHLGALGALITQLEKSGSELNGANPHG